MSSTGWNAAVGGAREVLAGHRRATGPCAGLLVPLLFTFAVDASPCATGEYQRAALAVRCDGDSGSLEFAVSEQERDVLVATFPVGTAGVQVTVITDAPADIQVIDHESGTCIVGPGCVHSTGCVSESSYCIDEQGMGFYFSGNLSNPPALEAAQTVAVSGPLTRTLDFVVLGSSVTTTGSANYTYGVVQPCPGVQPACSPCSSYKGCSSCSVDGECSVFGLPQCDGSPNVTCAPTTTGTTTPPSCPASHFRTSRLYAGCDSGEGFQTFSLSTGLTVLETLPAGLDGMRVHLDSSDDVHIQVLDENGSCAIGFNCEHSVDCRYEGNTCITYAGMWWYFSSSDEVLELFGNASQPLTLAVRANGTSTASVRLSYGVGWDCIRPGPNCAPCGTYAGCAVGETPACDGGVEVTCIPPETTTRTSSTTVTTSTASNTTTGTTTTATSTASGTSTTNATWTSSTTSTTTQSTTATSVTTATNTTMTSTVTTTTNSSTGSLWPGSPTTATTTTSASNEENYTATAPTTTTATATAAIPASYATEFDEDATASLGALVVAMLLAAFLVCCVAFVACYLCRYCCRSNSGQSIVPVDDVEKGSVRLEEETTESPVQQKEEDAQLQARPKVLVEFVRGGQRPLDLVCCVERCGARGEASFEGSLAFLEAMARHLDMPPVKVGILRYGDDASAVCPMADGREELLANIAGLGFEESKSTPRRLSPTLEDAGLMLQVGGFGETGGARKRAIIIVTDGGALNQDTEVDYHAASLKGHDVFLVIVLVGECKSPQFARSLASKPTEAFFFQVNSYDELPGTSMPVLQSVLESSLEVRQATGSGDSAQQHQVAATQQFPERRLELPGVLPWEPSPVEPSPPVPRDTRRPAPALVDVLPGLGGREDGSPKLVPSAYSTPGDERCSDKPRSPPTPSTAAPSQILDEISSTQIHSTQHHSMTGSGLPPLSPLVSTHVHAASLLRHSRLATEPPPAPPTTTLPAKPDNCPGDPTDRRSAIQSRSARRAALPPPPLLDTATTLRGTSPLQPLNSSVTPRVDCPDSPEFLQ